MTTPQASTADISASAANVERAFQSLLARRFQPARGLANRHVMTFAGHFIKRDFGNIAHISEERLFKVSEDARMLTHCGWQRERTAAPAVIVVHGLEGSSDSKYALGTAQKAYAAGFNVVRINQRGCGGTFHLSATPYHAGLTNDLRAIIDELVLGDGISSIYIVGFSLGGNQSLKLAGEYGPSPPAAVRGVCAVSVPIDLSECADALHWFENLLYEWNFLLSLHRSYRERQRLHPSRYNLPPFWRGLTLRRFDDSVVAPANGFRDANDYYAKSSSMNYLSQIRIPTLIIQAKDDPFIPFNPFLRVAMSEQVRLLATDHGGHVGYVGEPGRGEDRYWCENRAVEFFRLLAGF